MTVQINGANGLTFPDTSSQAVASKLLQVVNATYAPGAQQSTSSSSFVDTGLTATITPKFATSKILVLTSQSFEKGGADIRVSTQLVRNATSILLIDTELTITGSTASSYGNSNCNYLDSPATTSATTYKMQVKVVQGTGTVAWAVSNNGYATATITLMEIAP